MIAPLLAYLGLAALEGRFAAGAVGAPPLAVYAARLALVVGLVWAFRRHLPRLRPQPGDLDPRRIAAYALLASLLATVWVPLDRAVPHFAFASQHAALDPFAAYGSAAPLAAFLALRFFDVTVVVALVEELFYRDAALRFVTEPGRPDQVPAGRFSPPAFAVSVGLFAASHAEWLAALVLGVALCALLWQTRSLFACVAVRGTTNLLLGTYIVAVRDWQLW